MRVRVESEIASLHHTLRIAIQKHRIRKLQRETVLMASESLCSAVPQHPRSSLGSNQRSKQDESEIELLKSRVAELERKFDESRNEVRQVMAELEMLQRTIELLENEIQLQVGGSEFLFFFIFYFFLQIYKALLSITGNLFLLRYGGYGGYAGYGGYGGVWWVWWVWWIWWGMVEYGGYGGVWWVCWVCWVWWIWWGMVGMLGMLGLVSATVSTCRQF